MESSFGIPLSKASDHEKSELEIYRRELVSKDRDIDLLKKNIQDQQYEIHSLQMRVKELSDEKYNLRNNINNSNDRTRHLAGD